MLNTTQTIIIYYILLLTIDDQLVSQSPNPCTDHNTDTHTHTNIALSSAVRHWETPRFRPQVANPCVPICPILQIRALPCAV